MFWQYITDGGRTLPKDYEKYKKGNLLENICALCNVNAHDNFALLYIPNDIMKAATTGTYCCSTCQSEVEDMIQTVHYASYSEIVGMVNSSSFKKDEEVYNELIKNVKKRFIDNFEFPPDTFKHYDHLDTDISEYSRDMKDRCVFCKNLVTSNTFSGYIEVPVSISSKLTGGKVPICNSCDKSLPDIDYVYRKAEESVVRRLTCSECNDGYLVDHEEYQERYPKNHFIRWLCPSCAYNDAINADMNSIKYIAYNVSPKDEYENSEMRYRTTKCLCQNEVHIDLCGSSMSLMNSLLIYKDDRQFILCDSCNETVRPKLDKLSKLFRYQETWHIVYIDNDKVILGIINNGSIHIIQIEDQKDNVADTILELIQKALSNGK
jgi:hypothetical protein